MLFQQRQERQSFQWQPAKCHLHSSSKLCIPHTACGCLHIYLRAQISIIAWTVISEENKPFQNWVFSDEEKGQKLVTLLKSCFPLKSGSGSDTISHEIWFVFVSGTGSAQCFCWFFFLLLSSLNFLVLPRSAAGLFILGCLDTPAGSGLGRGPSCPYLEDCDVAEEPLVPGHGIQERRNSAWLHWFAYWGTPQMQSAQVKLTASVCGEEGSLPALDLLGSFHGSICRIGVLTLCCLAGGCSEFERTWPRGRRAMLSQIQHRCSAVKRRNGCATSLSTSSFEEVNEYKGLIPNPLLEGCLHCL